MRASGVNAAIIVRTVVYLKKVTCAFRVNFVFLIENAILDI